MDHKQKCKYRKNHKLQIQREFGYADIWTLNLLYYYANIDPLRKVQRFLFPGLFGMGGSYRWQNSLQCFVNHILNA